MIPSHSMVAWAPSAWGIGAPVSPGVSGNNVNAVRLTYRGKVAKKAAHVIELAFEIHRLRQCMLIRRGREIGPPSVVTWIIPQQVVVDRINIGASSSIDIGAIAGSKHSAGVVRYIGSLQPHAAWGRCRRPRRRWSRCRGWRWRAAAHSRKNIYAAPARDVVWWADFAAQPRVNMDRGIV